MPFFTHKKQTNFGKQNPIKRKNVLATQLKTVKKQKIEKQNGADEIISSEEDDFDDVKNRDESSGSEEETQQEKKLRLTKKYLAEIEKEEKNRAPDLDDTRNAVSRRLQEDALEEAGRLQKKVAKEYEHLTAEQIFTLRGHKLSVTCIAVSNSEENLYSASKDGALIKWCIKTGKKLKVIPGISKKAKDKDKTHVGHSAHVLALTIAHDDKFLASGCRNKEIHIWNPDDMTLLKTFRGHKDAITGLSFLKGSHQLISASLDRSLKLWNLDEMGYVDTLFGHQDGCTGIDSLHSGAAVTAGGQDSTLRVWKIVEESQLVFQGHGVSIDCVCVSSPSAFVSGANDGSISLWGLRKKKPLFHMKRVHGEDAESHNPNWISSICALTNADLLASGSNDGQVRMWCRNDEKNSLEAVSTLSVKGFVNAMSFSSSGQFLMVAVGQEHKLGRWWRIKEARNSIVVFKFPINKQ